MGRYQAELPSEKGLSLPLPKDLPALATDVLRECQLYIGGPVLRVDLQELQGDKGLMPGLGDSPWVSNVLSTLSLQGGPDPLLPTSLWITYSHCALSRGANGLLPACGSEGDPWASLPRATSTAIL